MNQQAAGYLMSAHAGCGKGAAFMQAPARGKQGRGIFSVIGQEWVACYDSGPKQRLDCQQAAGLS